MKKTTPPTPLLVPIDDRMKVRRRRLGHSDPRLIMKSYTHVASADDEQVGEQLREILDVVGQKQINPAVKEKGLLLRKPS